MYPSLTQMTKTRRYDDDDAAPPVRQTGLALALHAIALQPATADQPGNASVVASVHCALSRRTYSTDLPT